MNATRNAGATGATFALQSSRYVKLDARGMVRPFEVSYPHWGAALLWYRPERRLSVSFWVFPVWSVNWRLWGPRKLSFERE